MKVNKTASAQWKGGLKDGKGTISTESGALSSQAYGFNTRFEGVKGTNPEELLGAAHAGCFTMALSMMLGEAGFKPDQLDTQARVTLEQVDGGFAITAVHLKLTGKVPGIDAATFQSVADKAKAGCPLSKVINAPITLEASLG